MFSLQMKIQCEHPHSAIHQFAGTLSEDDSDVSVDASSLLLRGSSLKNTKWIIGIVVYTGRQTKLVMNSRGAPFKISGIEKTMNNILLVVLGALFFISLVSLISYIIWTNENYSQLDYLCYNFENSVNTIYRTECDSSGDYSYWGYFFTFFILYSNFLPISLYVTVEICNYYLAYYIDNDMEMYDELSDTPAAARMSNMNADLGMVQYILSDKTGTLTENLMRFKRCSIAGIIYGDALGSDELDESATWRDKGLDKIFDGYKTKTFSNKPLGDISSEVGMGSAPDEFVLSMALCHTCVLESETQILQSESPDENALVEASSDFGWAFKGRKNGFIRIEKRGNSGSGSGKGLGQGVSGSSDIFEYELLATIPFDGDRKRMTVVLRRQTDSKIIVYCKGADTVVLSRSKDFLG